MFVAVNPVHTLGFVVVVEDYINIGGPLSEAVKFANFVCAYCGQYNCNAKNCASRECENCLRTNL